MESCVHVCYEVILESMEHEKLHLFVGYKWRPVKNLFKQWQKFSFSWYISLKAFASQGLAFLFLTFYEFEKMQLPKAALLLFVYLPIHLVGCLDPLGCSWFWGKKRVTSIGWEGEWDMDPSLCLKQVLYQLLVGKRVLIISTDLVSRDVFQRVNVFIGFLSFCCKK